MKHAIAIAIKILKTLSIGFNVHRDTSFKPNLLIGSFKTKYLKALTNVTRVIWAEIMIELKQNSPSPNLENTYKNLKPQKIVKEGLGDCL